MGRSVSYPCDAQLIVYNHFDIGEEHDAEFDFECIIDDFQTHLRNMFPSVDTCDKWIGREDHVVAQNRHTTFGISEYCGLIAYWAIPQTELGKAWLNQIEPRFTAAFGRLTKTGTASNGEAFFERTN